LKELPGIVRREIQAREVISFARFMELALYCPESGYYERIKNNAGQRGDYYTSVSVGSLFGDLLACQFATWLAQAASGACRLLEAGAHDGQLAADILSWLQTRRPELFKAVEYWIFEPSVGRQRRQEKRLRSFAGKVRWFDGWQSVPKEGVHGVIFANELLDAMPVHRLGWDAGAQAWFEWGVGAAGEEFVWRKMPVSAEAMAHLPDLPSELSAVLPNGFVTEVSPAVNGWWRRAAEVLRQGNLLTFDYGLSAVEFFSPERTCGTLRAYRQHRMSDDLLGAVGEQDLTAHVNFTAIQEAGESAGLKTDGLFSQAHFLTRIVQAAEQAGSILGAWSADRVRQFQTLTHPEHLGTRFTVLVQSR
jgi:SAM-dependent MidA family methyltransferase